jgi:hypothetical protein
MSNFIIAWYEVYGFTWSLAMLFLCIIGFLYISYLLIRDLDREVEVIIRKEPNYNWYEYYGSQKKKKLQELKIKKGGNKQWKTK